MHMQREGKRGTTEVSEMDRAKDARGRRGGSPAAINQ